MILGERDRERVTTAEIQVVELGQAAYDWQQRAAEAERARDANAAQVRELLDLDARWRRWSDDMLTEATRQIDGARGALAGVVRAVRELHQADDVTAICRHCGFDYPCPTIAALP